MAERLLDVEDVGKKYARELRRVMFYGAVDILRDYFQVPTPSDRLRSGEFWALDGVNLKVDRGQCIGLIGANGSGKSTLLKLVSGIFMPDKGRIRKRGRVSSLVEIGAGFHPLLTGRENIYIYGQILGMTRREISQRFDAIVDYADIGDFLDTPVKHYSSGMFVRLGFAVAIHAEPDILLIDEVLAVGDAAFRAKCMSSISEAIKRTAVILVSHSMAQIESLCGTALWLNKGSVVQYGDSRNVVNAYLNWQEELAQRAAARDEIELETAVFDAARSYLEGRRGKVVEDSADADTPIQLSSFEVCDGDGQPLESVPFGSSVILRIRYKASRRIHRPLFNIRVDHEGSGVFEASMLIDGPIFKSLPAGNGIVECAIEHLPLTPKTYGVTLFVRSEEGVIDIAPTRTFPRCFKVTMDGIEKFGFDGPYRTIHLRHSANLLHLDHTWCLVPSEDSAP
ncbi:MAG: ABC transporter ATP-binding protein [Acidobacteriota bacterium]|jgi:lipopolysaccharide transport system ATP-binding protein|nr:ABC transporter ATP-binding protein [Acidobacteriota bacterium]